MPYMCWLYHIFVNVSMKNIVVILFLGLLSSTCLAQKYVGIDIGRYSTIGHNGFDFHLKSAQIQYSKGIIFEKQSDRFRYTTTIRWEKFVFDQVAECCDQGSVDGSYWGGELGIGMFNTYKDQEMQLIYGLQLLARSGRGELTVGGGWGAYTMYDPFNSAQVLLAPTIGFATRIHPRFRLVFLARTEIGAQVQDRAADLLGFTAGQSSLGFAVNTELPFRR
jgi:hypothetical protein